MTLTHDQETPTKTL